MNSGGLSSTHHVVVSESAPRCLALCLEQRVEKDKFLLWKAAGRNLKTDLS